MECRRLQKNSDSIILTTGYDVQGYFITKYIDVIFDEMLVGLGFGRAITSSFDNWISSFTGSEATQMIDKLNSVKDALRSRVVNKALHMGANALIGVDFESSKLGDLIMVSMTGTAVYIEKIISPLPLTEADKRAADEKRAAEEKRAEEARKMEEWKKASNISDYSFSKLIDACRSKSSAREILAFLESLEFSNIQIEKAKEICKKYVDLERSYGKMPESVIKKFEDMEKQDVI